MIFKAIGRFFARIGRWIRDTAWVQPLLIVGGIFAVIFSIPYLTNWVKSWFSETDASVTYYKKNKLTWKNIDKGTSQVDDMLSYLGMSDTDANYAKLHEKYGDKFFLNFVQEDCADCKANYEGYKTLQSKWGKGEFAFESGEEEEFKIFNIFVDVYDDDDEDVNYFQKYILSKDTTARYVDKFEDIAQCDSDHINSASLKDTVDNMVNDSEFKSPTIFLVERNFKGEWNYGSDVSDILFTVSGDDGLEKARTLWDFWNHTGDFSLNEND